MTGAVQYRNPIDRSSTDRSVVGFPGQDLGSIIFRGKRSEFDASSFATTRRAGTGGGLSFKQQREDRNRAFAALRQEIEAVEEPERWDGLA